MSSDGRQRSRSRSRERDGGDALAQSIPTGLPPQPPQYSSLPPIVPYGNNGPPGSFTGLPSLPIFATATVS
jgi:hypothetical protein